MASSHPFTNRFKRCQNRLFGVQMMDDEWFATMMNEAQVVLVTSWSDLVIRVIFSIGLLGGTGKMKDLLQRRHSRIATETLHNDTNQLDLVGPFFTTQHTVSKAHNNQIVRAIRRSPFGNLSAYRRRGLFEVVQIMLAIWGIVILVLHIDASLRPPLLECNPKVHPMAGALPSCFVVNFDCYQLGISGLTDEVNKEWGRFELQNFRYYITQQWKYHRTFEDKICGVRFLRFNAQIVALTS